MYEQQLKIYLRKEKMAMAKYMVTENEVKKALDIDSFRNISKENYGIRFYNSNMDKDGLKSERFPLTQNQQITCLYN